MRYKTEDEIKAQIAIHEASGATRKVQELKKFLSKPAVTTDGDKNEIHPSALYELHEKGFTWAEITKGTGVKTPWFIVKKYAEAEGLPYPVSE